MQQYDSVTMAGGIVHIVSSSGKRSWLTRDEAVEMRDKLDAAMRNADPRNGPDQAQATADKSGRAPCPKCVELQARVDALSSYVRTVSNAKRSRSRNRSARALRRSCW